MSIQPITADDLRRMKDQEGLILQGCGGNLDDWINGINDQLTKAGILKNSTRFQECFSFNNEGVTCLLFPFTLDVDLDVGKLAMWRLQTHAMYYGTWLSDYVPNCLGGFKSENEPQTAKPDCPLIGQNGNIFNLLGIASRTLQENGLGDQVKEMRERVMASGDYYHALNVIGDYVNITAIDGEEKLEERTLTL